LDTTRNMGYKHDGRAWWIKSGHEGNVHYLIQVLNGYLQGNLFPELHIFIHDPPPN
jgi:hypothetical protein